MTANTAKLGSIIGSALGRRKRLVKPISLSFEPSALDLLLPLSCSLDAT